MAKKKGDGKRKLVPLPHMIEGIRARNMKLEGAIEELADNSLGHGKATNVLIYIDHFQNGIAVIDNGTGVDDVNRIYRIGDASAYADWSEIGGYGVGAKHATIYLGNAVYVETIYKGRKHEYEVDWAAVERSGEWPDAYEGKGVAAKPDERGTQIHIGNLAHSYHLSSSERLATELGRVFSPALRRGTKIEVVHILKDGKTKHELDVKPFSPSDLTDEIQISGEIESKRGKLKWTGRAGLSASLTESRNRVHIAFGHRVIEDTREPFFGESASTLYVEVDLDAKTPWKYSLSDHKDKVVNNRDGLITSIHAQIKPLIEQAAEQSSYLALHGLTAPIETQLTKALKKAGVLHVNPDEEEIVLSGGVRGESDEPTTPTPGPNSGTAESKRNKRSDEGEDADGDHPTGVQIAWRTAEQLENKLWSWEITDKQMIIMLDAEHFKPIIDWPLKASTGAVINLVAAFLSHAIESEYEHGSPALIKALTPELRKQIEEWAPTKKIAPYLNRAILSVE